MIMFNNYKHIHFIGIGGSGISAIALLALSENIKVSGSDANQSIITDDLIKKGIDIYIGHKDGINEDVDFVVYTEAINKNENKEYLDSIERNIPVISYFEAIGEISKENKTIAVVGTHGKTTTTAMMGVALKNKPTVILGSRVPEFDNQNIYIGNNGWLIVEACEYRRSFLNIKPFGVVLLNCELDHLDYYKNEEDYISAFIEFIDFIPSDGFLVANMDDKNVRKVSSYCKGRVIEVNSDIINKLDLELSVFGDYNKSNAVHAYFTGLETGANEDDMRKGLLKFKGVGRRMELKGEFNDAKVFNDYAHHPTEIIASLKSLRDEFSDKKIICVFQPHQYSRTYELLDGFKNAFGDADMVIVPNIFEARDSDEDKKKINAEGFVENLSENHNNVIFGDGFENTKKILSGSVNEGDIIVLMGAGDVNTMF